MKRVNHHITETQARQLKKLASVMGISVARVIRYAINCYCEIDNEKEVNHEKSKSKDKEER